MKLTPNDKNITFKRHFYLRYMYMHVNRLLKTTFDECEHFNCNNQPLPDENRHIDIVTVAFNNVHVLEHQMDLLAKNITDKDVSYLVADNSDNAEKSEQIKQLCKQRNIGYVRLPRNKWLKKLSASYSHGAALNWIYYHYINLRKPCFFGFLDHDIYPLQKLSIEAKIGSQVFYGYRRQKGEVHWYIWPGLAFFRHKFIASSKVNFMPCMADKLYLDTGGSMWPALYSKFNPKDLNFASFERITLRTLGYDNDSPVEFMDGNTWFHSSNASYWRAVDNYEDIIDDIINKSLENQ